jgi:hypothetical protein
MPLLLWLVITTNVVAPEAITLARFVPRNTAVGRAVTILHEVPVLGPQKGGEGRITRYSSDTLRIDGTVDYMRVKGVLRYSVQITDGDVRYDIQLGPDRHWSGVAALSVEDDTLVARKDGLTIRQRAEANGIEVRIESGVLPVRLHIAYGN